MNETDAFIATSANGFLLSGFQLPFQVPSDRHICLTFKVFRENDVGIVQPVPVNVYDYYEPGW